MCDDTRDYDELSIWAYEELAEKDAEIERLREELDARRNGAERYWEGRWRDADAEIARLRDANEGWKAAWAATAKERDATYEALLWCWEVMEDPTAYVPVPDYVTRAVKVALAAKEE